MRSLRALVAISIVLLCSCTTTREVTDKHPYSKSLLVTCTLNWPTYLYKSGWERTYMVFTETIKGYGPRGQVISESQPNLILPPGTTVTGTRLKFESTMAGGPGIWIYGIAHSPSGTDLPVSGLVESVGIDLVDWQRKHPFRLLPPVSEYLRITRKGNPPWCESPDTPWKPNS